MDLVSSLYDHFCPNILTIIFIDDSIKGRMEVLTSSTHCLSGISSTSVKKNCLETHSIVIEVNNGMRKVNALLLIIYFNFNIPRFSIVTLCNSKKCIFVENNRSEMQRNSLESWNFHPSYASRVFYIERLVSKIWLIYCKIITSTILKIYLSFQFITCFVKYLIH